MLVNSNVKIEEIIKIALGAGKMAMDFYGGKYEVKQKQNKTPVTEADIAVNNYLMKELSKYNYSILSEEIEDNFEKRKNVDFFWIIDPLDGTSDFVQNTGEFSIMIGLVDNVGQSVLGVVFAPNLDEMYWAEKNKGAYLCQSGLDLKFHQKIQVSKKSLKNGKILTSRNHLGEYEQRIAKKYNMKQIPAGSAGLKICWIARGDAELYINSSDKSGLWDTCAADIILSEAGGFMVDKNFNKIKYNTKETALLDGYIASNFKMDLL
jgi:3'(2'), 5'-bisphosphate nucleotidase